MFPAIALATAGGLFLRMRGDPVVVPQMLASFLDVFIGPGLFVWWITLGGAFEGFPSQASGIVVAGVGNVAFWLVLVYSASAAFRYVRRRIAPRR